MRAHLKLRPYGAIQICLLLLLLCWQTSLTKEQMKQFADVQRRALQIIFGNILYDEARRTVTFCHKLNVDTNLWQKIFPENYQGQVRDVQLTTRLRCARQYPTIYARTNRYKNSSIIFGLSHLQ